MLTYAIATLFAVAGVTALIVIGAAVRGAAPKVAALRRELVACPERLAVSARVVETVTAFDDGKVVRIPVRARLLPAQGLRAAA